jgi:hypothetical protein
MNKRELSSEKRQKQTKQSQNEEFGSIEIVFKCCITVPVNEII